MLQLPVVSATTPEVFVTSEDVQSDVPTITMIPVSLVGLGFDVPMELEFLVAGLVGNNVLGLVELQVLRGMIITAVASQTLQVGKRCVES